MRGAVVVWLVLVLAEVPAVLLQPAARSDPSWNELKNVKARLSDSLVKAAQPASASSTSGQCPQCAPTPPPPTHPALLPVC